MSWAKPAPTKNSCMMVGSAAIIIDWEMHAAVVPAIIMPSTIWRCRGGRPPSSVRFVWMFSLLFMRAILPRYAPRTTRATQKTTRGAAAPLDSYTTFDFSTCSTNQLTSFMVGLRNTKPSNANGTT